MISYCPLCGNLMFLQQGSGRMQLTCNVCPIVQPIKQTITSRTFYKLKEIDEVLGGAEAWKNVDNTEERCPKCAHPRAYFMQIQTRSADEPMTTFYRCCSVECGHNWRD
ncbi:DNA-directed RNA polymerase III subunit RPC10 [Atheta coriaria]|uniref:DNA-directed RNA polymerase III subunit RPC10 n=1 Tax=Dalotia coriaria TaxID=877792 RepID=UPI0031F39F16